MCDYFEEQEVHCPWLEPIKDPWLLVCKFWVRSIGFEKLIKIGEKEARIGIEQDCTNELWCI